MHRTSPKSFPDSGIIGMVPVTFIVNTNVDRNDIDHPLHLYHRIELTFSTGRLCLVNTHGPVIWLPFLHMPRDEYGTLSINVEEEVNIPSGVTIGNVMLPSVKETFEQIWPDAVKKALEILFKQNRTEKKCPWRNIKYMYQNYGLKYVRKWAI